MIKLFFTNLVLLLLPCLVLLSLRAEAEGKAVFSVMASKGHNYMDGQPLKVGIQIFEDQELAVGYDSYVALAHHSGKTWETQQMGVYQVRKLDRQMRRNDPQNPYTRFVVAELTGQKVDRSRFGKPKLGTVSRQGLSPAVEITYEDRMAVTPALPLLLYWYATDERRLRPNTLLRVHVEDIYNEPVFEMPLQDSICIIDLRSGISPTPERLLLDIRGERQGQLLSTEYELDRPADSVASQTLAYLSAHPPGSSPLNWLALAHFLEEHGLMANAAYAYHRAYQLSQSAAIRRLHDAFLWEIQLWHQAARQSDR